MSYQDPSIIIDPDGGSTGMASGNATPAVQNVSWNRQGVPPPLLSIDLSVYNADFISFYIAFENSFVEWLAISGMGTSGTLPSATSQSLSLQYQNLPDLFGSNYKAKIYFTFSKAGLADLQRMVEVNLALSGISPTSIQTDKTNYNLVYRRDNNTLSGETTINILNNTSSEPLFFQSFGTLLHEGLAFTTSYTLQEDAAHPFATNLELPQKGVKVVDCKLIKDNVVIQYFTVTITVIETDEIIATPANFDFFLRKDFSETKQGILKITNPVDHAFTITGPPWLSFSATSGSGSPNITVTTSNSSGMDLGIHTGNIVISYGSKTVSIPVTATVAEFVELNLETNNFCMDGIFLQANKMNDAGYFMRMILDMTFETSGGISEHSVTYAIPYFEGKISTDIGKRIQNFFPVFQNHFLYPGADSLIYKAALVDITFEELNVNYEILYTKTISGNRFFAGKKPECFPVFTDFFVRTKYDDSSVFYSILNNDEVVFETGLPNEIQTVDLPETENPIHVQWLNQNLVPEWATFAYKHQKPSDFEHTIDDFEEDAEKYEARERKKITINTGWKQKYESRMIAEIIKSRIVFMRIDGTILKGFCISSKLVAEDSENNFEQYDLEFKIVD